MQNNIFSKQYLFIILLIAVLISPALAFADADKVFKENNKAVVVVKTYNEKGKLISQGSGFIVRADGAVVTNYHVISNAVDIKVKTGDKVLDVEGLIHIDKENDLVILKVKGKNLPTVKLGDIKKANIGEKVYVISSPQGLENTISDGILSGIREIIPERKVLQITAPISLGSSGGPVFNKDGEVIGITTFIIEEAQNLNFAMPVNLIKDKIDTKKVVALKDSKIEDYKKTAAYWVYLSIYYLEAGLNNKAVDAYKQIIRLKPDYKTLALAYEGLGLAYGNLGRYSEEVDAYKQVIKIKPNNARAHNLLGNSYSRLGRYDEAIDAYKQAIRVKPNYADAYFGLGVTYGQLRIYREAVKAYKEAIKIKPDDAKAYYNLGFTFAELSMYKEALVAYKQVIRLKPDDTEIHFIIGITYDELGMYKEALVALKQAIRLQPDDANGHVSLGIVYHNLGMYKEALVAFKQAIRLQPDHVYAHFKLGHAYLILNDKGSALEEYKILKDLNPQLANELFNVIYE